MLTIGNDELDALPRIGDTVQCWKCGKLHPVRYGERILPDGTREPSRVLGYFTCRGKAYLCSVAGKEWRPKGT